MSRETWNHRIIEFVDPDGSVWRAIHEVHYADGKPIAYGERPAIVEWDEDEGNHAAILTLERMRKAIDKPVLVERDFEGPTP